MKTKFELLVSENNIEKLQLWAMLDRSIYHKLVKQGILPNDIVPHMREDPYILNPNFEEYMLPRSFWYKYHNYTTIKAIHKVLPDRIRYVKYWEDSNIEELRQYLKLGCNPEYLIMFFFEGGRIKDLEHCCNVLKLLDECNVKFSGNIETGKVVQRLISIVDKLGEDAGLQCLRSLVNIGLDLLAPVQNRYRAIDFIYHHIEYPSIRSMLRAIITERNSSFNLYSGFESRQKIEVISTVLEGGLYFDILPVELLCLIFDQVRYSDPL